MQDLEWLKEIYLKKRSRKRLLKEGNAFRGDKIISSHSYFEVVYIKMEETVYVITVKPRW